MIKNISYLITYRESHSPDRRDNLLAVLNWLSEWPNIEVIVVEQDSESRLDPLLPAAGKPYFAYNPGSFNKSWGYNLAATLATHPIFVFGDADMIAPPTLEASIKRCEKKCVAVKPYKDIVDLTPDETALVRKGWWNFIPERQQNLLPSRESLGEYIVFGGGIFVIRRATYFFLGGFDERFRGWGAEDDAMTLKLVRSRLPISTAMGPPALHLWHPRSQEATFGQPHYEANKKLLNAYQSMNDADFKKMIAEQKKNQGDWNKYRDETTSSMGNSTT